MLKAIVKGKAGRVEVESGSSVSWRQLFREREDLLTAAFFGRLRYLSEQGERKVMALLLDPDAVEEVGFLKEIHFWPKFSKEEKGHVEPDVLLTCEKGSVLVEVKPPFRGEQSFHQWKREMEYAVKDASEDMISDHGTCRLHFLALGRNVPDWQVHAQKLERAFADFKLRVHTKEWLPLRDGIAEIKEEAGRDSAVYADLLEAFQLFGIRKRLLPFSEMENLRVRNDIKELYMGWEPYDLQRKLQRTC